MRECVLDIGTGRGGAYLDGLAQQHHIVAFDIRDGLLTQIHKNENIQAVSGDATRQLPFTDGMFVKVNIILPFNTLLIALINPVSQLFTEISRVMQSGAKLNIITDLPPSREYDVPVDMERTVKVRNHHRKIEGAVKSTKHFSKVELYRLHPNEAKKIGTETIRLMRPGSSAFVPDIYRIRAKKRLPERAGVFSNQTSLPSK